MLIIEHEPLYRNKILLSSLAILAGFILTLSFIRITNPAAPTSSQSAPSNAERPAQVFKPIVSNESETSPESAPAKGVQRSASPSTRSTAAPQGSSAPEAQTPRGGSQAAQPQSSPAALAPIGEAAPSQDKPQTCVLESIPLATMLINCPTT